MYSSELIDRLTVLLAPDGFTPRAESEVKYPERHLPEGAIVTRSAPSPTGFVHIGTIYMSLINKLVATQTKGVNMLRVEDTDKKRELEDGVRTIVSALAQFSLTADEGVDIEGQSYGAYGPYLQSERGPMYLGFAVELLQKGRAYPCFASAEELDANYKQQQAEKVRPGYYGKWAIWRDRSEADITEALDAGKPFVLRFRSQGSHEKRIGLDDVLKGHVELPENDLDVPLIKSDEWRLPTYHLAHIVDDFLMRTTVILRGDEWLPSTPLHVELAQALGIEPFKYAHFAPISILDKGNKRKLSKRKDPEADIQYFVKAGYPEAAVLEYLVGLANSNYEDWKLQNPGASMWDFPFTFEKWAKARGALLDMQKLDDYGKDHIASLPQAEFENQLLEFAERSGWSRFVDEARSDVVYSNKVFAIERGGEKPRKDMSHWAQAADQYAYFFDGLFELDFKRQGRQEFLSDLDEATIFGAAQAFLQTYDPADDQPTWFDKLKGAAEATGFATDNKAYKENPDSFKGNTADFARIIRVLLTGKNRTPDLWTIMQAMGPDRVRARLATV